jgi:peptide chain release factor 1
MIPSGKLESLSRRFAEVEQLLCDPKTLADPQALTTLNRERTQLHLMAGH